MKLKYADWMFVKLAVAVVVMLTVGTAQAVDNTGTGGTITYTDAGGLNPVASPPYIGGYVVHTFTNSGAYSNSYAVSADVLVVAGGGGGGGNGGGGGGAGGLIYSNNFAVVSGSNYTVTVGAGGSGGTPSGNGNNSVFATQTAIGGGGGGSRDSDKPGHSGGSGGGGGAADASAGTKGSGTAGPPRQGYDGGTGIGNGTTSSAGGGGGGAGGVGTNGVLNLGGNGGNGVANSISGSSVTYAGGGGGGTTGAGNGGTGGSGGGGNGARVGLNATNGVANTGGGGGGGGSIIGSGGSGIVIVRYPYDAGSLYVSLTAPANGQILFAGSSVMATATVVSGTSPYDVSFFADTAGGGMVQVGTTQNGTGPTFTQSLGTPATGTYQVYATVTDNVASNATSVTNTFTVAVPSSNAYLFNLVPSAGTLSPAFASNTFSYTETVSNAVSSLTVTPTAADAYATIRVNDIIVASGSASASISLGVGDNVITNQVISQDTAVTNTYTLTVTRARASTSQYWSGNGSSQGGNGTWDTANTRWGTVAGGPFSTVWGNVYNDTAIFGGTAGTVTLGTNVQVGGLTFNTSGYTIGGAYTLAFGVASGITNNIGSITFADGVSVTNMGAVTVGSGVNSKSLTATNANLWSGALTIGAGASANNAITVYSGATWNLQGNAIYIAATGNSAVSNSLTVNGGTVTNTSGISVSYGGANVPVNHFYNSMTVTNGGRVFVSGPVWVPNQQYSGTTRNHNYNSLVVADGGLLSSIGGGVGGNTSWSSGSYNTLQVNGGGVGRTATWNLGGGDYLISSAGPCSYNALTINGAGVAGGAVMTNVNMVTLNGVGNSIALTNGARMFTTNYSTIGSTGASSNTMTIVGGAADSIWNGGGSGVTIGSAGNYNQLLIDAGGTLTNAGSVSVGNYGALSNRLTVINGGQLSVGNMSVGNHNVGNPIGNAALIANGGRVNLSGAAYIGSISAWEYARTLNYNSLTITNGGRLFSSADSYIGSSILNSSGYVCANNNNTVTIGGSLAGTNATWNLSGKNLYVGAVYSGSTATGNVLTASSGGVVTNISILTIKAANSLALGVGGQIYAGVVTNAGTVNVVLDNSGNAGAWGLNVTGRLDITGCTLNITGEGLGVFNFANYGTLIGSRFAVTNGLPDGARIEYTYGSANQIAIVAPPGGTVIMFR